MFRLNWPETELLFGQYWAFDNEYAPETAQDAGLNFHGTSTHRLAQIRLTQKFAGRLDRGRLDRQTHRPRQY